MVFSFFPPSFVGPKNNQLKLDWPTRLKICIGIARGLAFLHEESRLKIVHRDIKATNVLLDGDLNPKISDFGLARLDEEEKSHISTRVAGTMLVNQCFKILKAVISGIVLLFNGKLKVCYLDM